MIALLATVAISTAATNDDALQEKEKAAWQAFKDKKPDDFKKVVSAKFVGVYAEGMSDMQKEVADMQKWDMKSLRSAITKPRPLAPTHVSRPTRWPSKAHTMGKASPVPTTPLPSGRNRRDNGRRSFTRM